MNKCMFIGNLGKDAEFRDFGGDKGGVLSFSIATTEKWKDKSGNPQEKCEWTDCSLFGPRGVKLAQYLKKGQSVFIEGRKSTDLVEKDGKTTRYTKIIVTNVELLGKKEGGSNKSEDPLSFPPEDTDDAF